MDRFAPVIVPMSCWVNGMQATESASKIAASWQRHRKTRTSAGRYSASSSCWLVARSRTLEDRQQEPVESGMIDAKPLGRHDVHRQGFQFVQRGHGRGTHGGTIDERLLAERVAALEDIDRDDVAERPGQADRARPTVDEVDRARRITLVEHDLAACEMPAAAGRPKQRLVQTRWALSSVHGGTIGNGISPSHMGGPYSRPVMTCGRDAPNRALVHVDIAHIPQDQPVLDRTSGRRRRSAPRRRPRRHR